MEIAAPARRIRFGSVSSMRAVDQPEHEDARERQPTKEQYARTTFLR
jgi:hypothetical protein